MREHLLDNGIAGPGKRILVRIDVNGSEKEGYKIWRYGEELKRYQELAKKGCSVVLVTHYGRRTRSDFRDDLSFVSQALSESSGVPLRYVHRLHEDDLVDETREPGVYLLKNVRCSEHERNGGVNPLCEFMRDNFDIFVNDAPAVCHREHTSVMLPEHMEARVGNVLLEEISRLDSVKESDNRVLVWGGAKIKKVKKVAALLEDGWRVLMGGLPAASFRETLDGKDNGLSVLNDYTSQVAMPLDYVVRGGRVVDIGPKTVAAYEEVLRTAGGIFSGPMGIYELGYEESSVRLMRLCEAILGGHSGNVAYKHGIKGILTSGGAALAYLADGDLPGLKVIRGR